MMSFAVALYLAQGLASFDFAKCLDAIRILSGFTGKKSQILST